MSVGQVCCSQQTAEKLLAASYFPSFLSLLFSHLLSFIDSLSHYDDVTIEVVLGRTNLLVSSALERHFTRVF